MKRIILPLLLGGALTFQGTGAAAAMMRCHGRIVSTGDPQALVLARCGPPAYRQILSGGAGSRAILVEEWTYFQGPNRFIKTLRFVGGQLVDIVTGKRQ